MLLLCLLPRNLGRNVTRSTWGSLFGCINRFTCPSGVAGIQSHCALSHMRKNALAFNETEYVSSGGSTALLGDVPSKLWLSEVKIPVNYCGSCKKTSFCDHNVVPCLITSDYIRNIT